MRFGFTVDGPPVPAPRPKVVRGGAGIIKDKRYEAYREAIAYSYLAAVKMRMHEGPVGLKVIFCMPNHRRVDIDNLLKGVMDALNGLAYKDDSQVTTILARKTYDAKLPRTMIRIHFGDDDA